MTLVSHLLALCAIVLIAAVGCAAPASPPQAQPSFPAVSGAQAGKQITVAAASDLNVAFAEIGKLFENETGARVTFSFGSSGTLETQIENGAPIDLFASADEGYIQQLASKGLIVDGTVQVYAIGRIVLASNRASGVQVGKLEDLLEPAVKHISLANPDHAPYGRAARQALESKGMWGRVSPRLVLGENISQALQFVKTGNAEAGIVALSIANVPEVSYVLIDDSLHQPLKQTMAVVKGTKQEAPARDFAAFVNGPKGRPIMQKYGFILPEER